MTGILKRAYGKPALPPAPAVFPGSGAGPRALTRFGNTGAAHLTRPAGAAA